MEEKKRRKLSRKAKRWIRISAVAIVAIVITVMTLSKMNIEPASYDPGIRDEITQAKNLIEGVDITKGEYTTHSIEELQQAVEEAEAILENPDATYSDLREAYLMLKDAIKKFKDSKNNLRDGSEGSSTEPESSSKSSVAKSSEEQSSTEAKSSQTESAQPSSSGKEMITVYITIDCHNLTAKKAHLDPAKKRYCPDSGVILGRTAVKIEKGKSVFDVLNKICRDKKIHVSSRYTPMYGSYYVEGINHLFEFDGDIDGGYYSGWMYKVNGWYPNYGCSAYTCKEGDEIVWSYTCSCGVDLGQPDFGKPA
ncbi:MAG: DUF4430 domain-containing protein [Lachnospiraceae bacterium]|jgi:hypothetical protein|nr:DUF4430 domain-containing protein [Lachnospiraceae bacterium]